MPEYDAPGDSGAGRARQDSIYRAGILGRTPTVPTEPARLKRAARKRMSRKAWAYLGYAGTGATGRANREAFDRRRIVPRVASGAVGRDLSTQLLGANLPAPALLAPVGAADLIRADADALIGRGAAQAQVPYIVSNQGGTPMEQTAAAMGPAPRWFQLYWSRDEALVDSFITRAEAIGAGALVVTLDTTLLGWRPDDLDLGSLPFTRGFGIAQYTSDPRFEQLVAERLATTPTSDIAITPGAVRTFIDISRRHPGRFIDNLRSAVPRAAVETFLDVYSNPALTWRQLATLRDRTRLPIVLKGILHPDDAIHARDCGADAVIVSNHGGRQVDGATASIDALPRVRDAVGRQLGVILDSGVRSGADIFKALAMGADAVTIGRPHVYGLAVGGPAGVADVVTNLIAELDLIMGLCGASTINELTPDMLEPSTDTVGSHES